VITDAVAPIEHDRELALFHGASEILARVRLIGTERLERGERGWLQLHLAQPTVLAAGDRIVLRLPSPSRTIGGGLVLDPRAPRFWRRFDPAVAARFEALAQDDPAQRAWHGLRLREPCRAAALSPPDTGLEPAERAAALASLAQDSLALALGHPSSAAEALWITSEGWQSIAETARELLGDYHSRHPLRVGPPPEELRERLDLAPEAFAAAMAQSEHEGWLAREGARPHLAGHAVRFDEAAEAASAALLARFRSAPYSSPSAADARTAVGEDVLEALLARGDLIAVTSDVLFDRTAFEELRAWVVTHVGEHGQVTVADLRDRFDTSRKYALGFLEHLDRIHVTRRVGDARVLARASGA
jgi:selenocysteine-specific elongation factor